MRYSSGVCVGGRNRVHALLLALRRVIEDFEVPTRAVYAHALTTAINAVVQRVALARPLSVSMGNAVKSLKTHLARIGQETMHDDEAKEKTLTHVDYFIGEKLIGALHAIVAHATALGVIADGDVIATHGKSEVVLSVLLGAKKKGTAFSVVVIDSRPGCEGRDVLAALLRAGVPCSYVAITAVSYIMGGASVGGPPAPTKVVMGAAAVMGNGSVVSRSGALAVAVAAKAWDVPVIVACETCKFHERVQLDGIVHNELGHPGALATVPGRPDIVGLVAKAPTSLHVLNLVYDIVPPDCVASVLCESGLVTPGEVTAFLR